MKKLLSIVLVVAMLMSLAVTALPTISAAESDGTNAELEAQGYTGITALNQIQGGKKYYLKNDLTITSRQGFPSGTADSYTILDGNGHTINYTGTSSLFGWAEYVHIKNLNVVGSFTEVSTSVNNQNYNGGGALSNGFEGGCILENIVCDVDQTLVGPFTHSAGGVVSKQQSGDLTMINVVNKGDITYVDGSSTPGVGGLVGHFSGNNLTMTDCSYEGTITYTSGKGNAFGVSGLVGYCVGTNINITNSTCKGTINLNGLVTVGVSGIATFHETKGAVVIDGCKFSGQLNVAAYSTAEDGTETDYTDIRVGGIAAVVDSGTSVNIKNCVVDGGTITVTRASQNGALPSIGGIVGRLDNIPTVIDNCLTLENTAKTPMISLTGSSGGLVGGIVGRTQSVTNVTVKNCVNTADITRENMSRWGKAGGVIGATMTVRDGVTSNITISGCHNLGDVKGPDASGILGGGHQLESANLTITIENCSNYGTMNGGATDAAGIAGYFEASDNTKNNGFTLSIKNCYNAGAINGTYAAGILASMMCGQKTTTVDNCANTGTITGSAADRASSIVERCSNTLTITNSVTEGTDENAAAKEQAAHKATASSWIFSGYQMENMPKNKDLFLIKDITMKNNGGNYYATTPHTIDGQGHTVTFAGGKTLINYAENLIVKNLTLNGTIAADYNDNHFGPLLLHGIAKSAHVENIVSDVDITVTGTSTGEYSGGGVIGKLDVPATIKNVKFTGTINYNSVLSARIGGVIGAPAGGSTLENVSNEGTININAKTKWGIVGGVMGEAYNATLINVTNKGKITVASAAGCPNVGGIAGKLMGNTTMTNCSNTDMGDIEVEISGNGGHNGLGGLVGYMSFGGSNRTASITNCVNDGDVKAVLASGSTEAWDYHLGGIVGRVHYEINLTVEKCTNNGAVMLEQNAHNGGWDCVGGIVGGFMTPNEGVATQYTIKNCINNGTVTGMENVGGILGGTKQLHGTTSVDVIGCINNGTVDGKAYPGGIVGSVVDSIGGAFYDLSVDSCINAGKVITTNSAAAGILGRFTGSSEGYAQITKNVNAGIVEHRNGSTHGRGGDSWVHISGIAGTTASRTNFTNNIHLGQLVNNNGEANDALGTFPIVNAVEVLINGAANGDQEYLATLITGSGNIYLDGTALLETCTPYGSDDQPTVEAPIPAYRLSSKVAIGEIADKMEAIGTIGYGTARLEAAIAEKDTLAANQSSYVPALWTAYTEAVSAGQTALSTFNGQESDFWNRKQATVAQAEAAIVAAKPLTKTEFYVPLDTAISTAEGVQNTDNAYTARSWKAFKDAIQAAKDGKTNNSTDIEGLIKGMTDAQAALVDTASLKAAIATANAKIDGKTQSDFTSETWTPFAAAKQAAEAILTDANATEDVTGAISSLTDATNGLRSNILSERLQQHIDEMATLTSADYTEGSWSAYGAAVEAARNAITNEGDLEAAEAALLEAKAALVDLRALKAAIANANTVKTNAADYISLDGLDALITAAQAVVDNGAATKTDVETALENLNTKLESLISIKALKEVIAAAEDKDRQNYRTEGYNALVAELAEAQAALEATTQAAVNDATTALNEKLDALVSATPTELMDETLQAASNIGDLTNYTASSRNAFETAYLAASTASGDGILSAEAALYNAIKGLKAVNFTALQQAISDTANVLAGTYYTSATWNAYRTALTEAQRILNGAESQTEIDNAATALRNAFAALTEAGPTSTQKLNMSKLISNAEKLVEKHYTPATWTTLKGALAAAKALGETATKLQYETAYKALEEAVDGLSALPAEDSDYEALQTKIDAAEGMNKNNYTAESWAALQEAIAAAEAALAKTQLKDVEAALAVINEAIDGLQSKVPTVKPEQKPENDPEQPKETAEPTEEATEAPTEAPAATDADGEAEGGCGSAIAGAAVVLCTVVAMGAGICLRKKED